MEEIKKFLFKVKYMKLRPETLTSSTTKVETKYGALYITITEQDSKPLEVFCTIGKSGQSIMAKAEVVGRLASLALRNEVSVKEVVEQLLDIDGGGETMWKGQVIKSIPDIVGKVLKERYLNVNKTD